jgi:hypothetical protein
LEPAVIANLPGLASANEAQRWKAAIQLGEFVERVPEAVWGLVAQWGCSDHEDTRAAVANCVLEHLLEHHFASVFPRVEELALADPRFADTFCWCWRFGQSDQRRRPVPVAEARLLARGTYPHNCSRHAGAGASAFRALTSVSQAVKRLIRAAGRMIACSRFAGR